ncbi:MAG: CRISPR system precrRNA processing endoribonuclease RAMP protein Cas6 [Chloroflexaceae bacterium]|nr:CRISPR system precrRNA processing endoribonuclease RAMP protein Cas6 [Chloroflexaceae bacterium]
MTMPMIPDPDVHALVIELLPEEDVAVPPISGAQVQGLLLELMRQSDPELSNVLHMDVAGKPFTVAVLPPHGSRARGGPAPVLVRVTLLQAGLFGPLMRALLSQVRRPALRLGQVAMQLGNVWGTPESHQWAGFARYAELAARVQAGAWVRVQFATPTAIAQGAFPDGRKRLELLPTPAAVFGSVGRRWNQLAPPELGMDAMLLTEACHATVVAEHRLRVGEVPGRPPQRGFVGWCSYELPRDAAQRHALTLLADAAFYLGVGVKTTRGQGLCRRVDVRGEGADDDNPA